MHVKCKYVVGVLAGKIQHLRSFWDVCYHYIMMHYCVLVPFTRTVNCSEIMHWLLRPELCNLCSSLRPETSMAANSAVGVCPAGAGYCPEAHPGWCMPRVWHQGVHLRCPCVCPQQEFWVRTLAPVLYKLLAWGGQGGAVSGTHEFCVTGTRSAPPGGVERLLLT